MNKETFTVYKDKDGTIRHFNADGQLHNENGPAVIYSSGDKEHWVDGEFINEAKFQDVADSAIR